MTECALCDKPVRDFGRGGYTVCNDHWAEWDKLGYAFRKTKSRTDPDAVAYYAFNKRIDEGLKRKCLTV